jgi:predicted secreted protein
MQIASVLAVFFIVWWLCFMLVLPMGHRSQLDNGDFVRGTDPGAPVSPRLWRKVALTSLIAAVMTALLLWSLTNETLYHYWNR